MTPRLLFAVALQVAAATALARPFVPSDDAQVLERLPDHAGAFPLEVLECAKRLIEGQTSHVELSSWGEDLRRIFSQTRNHPAPEVRQASDDVIEVLGRFGHLGYADLLSRESG